MADSGMEAMLREILNKQEEILKQQQKLKADAQMGFKKLQAQVQAVLAKQEQFSAELAELRAPVLGETPLGPAAASAAVVEESLPSEAAMAIDVLARKAKEAMRAFGHAPQALEKLEEQPLDSRRIAEAHDLVEKCQPLESRKLASRLLRDLLVLTECVGARALEPQQLREKMFRAFHWEKDARRKSQFILAFKTIVSLGTEWSTFMEKAKNIYKTFDEAERDVLFKAYKICADNSRKRSRSSHKKSTASAAESCAQEDKIAAAMDDTDVCSCPEDTSAKAAKASDRGPPLKYQTTYSWDYETFTPDSAAVNNLHYPGARVRVHNGFLGVIVSEEHCQDRVVQASDSGPQQKHKTKIYSWEYETFTPDSTPGSSLHYPGAHVRVHNGFLGDFIETEEQRQDAPEVLARICKKCNRVDDKGWTDRRREYVCPDCWKEEIKHSMAEWVPKSWAPQDFKGFPGGPVIWYHGLQPFTERCATPSEIHVVDQCCLKVARDAAKSGTSVCLLVMGSERGPLVPHKRDGQSDKVWKLSTLPEAALLARHYTPEDQWLVPVPRGGGIYLSNVQLLQECGAPFEPPCVVSMIYAVSSRVLRKGSEAQAKGEPSFIAFRSEMKTKVLNVLRICRKHRHEELVLGAWGCGTRDAPARHVAEIFQEALLGDSDVANAFKRVTFAIHKSPSALDTFAKIFAPYTSQRPCQDLSAGDSAV